MKAWNVACSRGSAHCVLKQPELQSLRAGVPCKLARVYIDQLTAGPWRIHFEHQHKLSLSVSHFCFSRKTHK